ncbi:Serine/threonine protein kinase [Singulisphaera sp. GP187]|uniref:serine/threonine-protein kinase n=1 Tax=Singulisphaera sp. GP187 TaxID=1882752 RepID=UPI0009277203|nr:serine/threonine-protein kinase [Singulisphaera sp. GP187]SIO25127.1 Serine/threonine protein kinase [Singulisphaera sp. GP187]
MKGCPEGERFVLLLQERLDSAEQAFIVGHVETCPHCQDYLEALTAGGFTPFETEKQESRREPFAANAGGDGPPALGRRRPDWPSLPAGARRSPLHGFSRSAGSPWPSVPDFEILEELGRGGMGVVYKARQRSLNRLVALKMIRDGGRARPRDLARFRIEAKAVARLRHANILQIYEIGDEAGLPFVALELLEGGSLEVRLAGTPQPGPRAAETLGILARAIHAAHQAGIIHRDLKPSNVLFTCDGIPKITDFGLAKRLEEDDGHTESGQVMGSPSYISPEQARGRNREVGPTADVYSLGAILYQMLTGRPPFRGTTPVETVMQVIHEEPVPPSRLLSKVPRDLETICLKCLDKEPRRRYPSASDLADDLGRYLAEEPIRARPTPLWERALKWTRRRPTAAILVALGVASGVGLGVSGLRYERDMASARLAGAYALNDAKKAAARGDLNGARDTLVELSTRIEKIPSLADLDAQAAGLLDRIRRGLAGREAREAASTRFDRFLRLRDEAIIRDVHFTGLDLPDDPKVTRLAVRAALAVFEPQGQAGSGLVGSLPDALTAQERDDVVRGTHELLLVLAESVSRPAAGEDPVGQAREALRILDVAAQVLPLPSPAYHLRRAACLTRAGDEPGASRQRVEAERLEPANAFDHFLLGREWSKRGSLVRAKRHFDAALRLQPDHFWALCLSAICELNASPPHPEVAKAALRDCLARHPDFAWLYLLRGFASGQIATAEPNQALAEQSFEDAEADFRKALELGAGQELRYALRVNRGLIRFKRDRPGEAAADLREAIALDPARFNAYVTLAHLDREQGQPEEAAALLDRAIELKPDLAPLYRTRALWKLESKDRDAALLDLDEALRRQPPRSPEAAGDHALRGHLLCAAGRYQEALNACDAALEIDPEEAEAHRWRVAALLELKRYDDVLHSCDGYLANGKAAPELLEIRGLAKAHRKDYAGSIADYTRALALKPDRATLYTHRGWAHLISEAPKLALLDFEEAVRLDPGSGDAFSGRGSALVLLGQHRSAVADAEEALRHGEPTPRMYYNAARTYAQASTVAAAHVGVRGRETLDVSFRYQDRSLELLGDALGRIPDGQRDTFWREVIHADEALRAIRRRPRFSELSARFAPTDP